MKVSWLHLRLPCLDAISSVDDPGIWSLLKIRGLAHLTISGPRRCIVPRVRAWLKARTHKKKLFPWQPLGVENPANNWTALVKHRDDQPPWQQQYEWLDAQYKYLHDRETVAARRTKQRAAYHKRRRRWPMPASPCSPFNPTNRQIAYIRSQRGRGIGSDFVIGK